MTAFSGEQKKGAQLLDENGQLISDAADPSHPGDDLSSSSPHLDSILDKINAIMAETPAERRLREVSLTDTPAAAPKLGGDLETGAADGFVANEPMDLLAPYSAVLNDVRDYFKGRHSLDPNDRLSHDLQPPIGQGREAVPEAKVFGNERAADSGGDGPGATDSQLQGAELHRVEESEAGMEFGKPLSGRAVTSEVMVSEREEVQVFRHELMSRIGQLEQVISHHFGSQKSVAADAAKAAVALTMQSLDETPIGQRLAALEQAFENFKQADARANEVHGGELQDKNTGQLGLPFADTDKVEAMRQGPEVAGVKPENAISLNSRGEGGGAEKVRFDPSMQGRGMMPPSPQPLVRERKSGEGVPSGEVGATQILDDSGKGSDRAGALKAEDGGMQARARHPEAGGGMPLPPLAAPLSRNKTDGERLGGVGQIPSDLADDRAIVSPPVAAPEKALNETKDDLKGQAADGGVSEDSAALGLSIKQLRAQFQKEAEQRFGAMDQDEADLAGMDSKSGRKAMETEDGSALVFGKTAAFKDRFQVSRAAANDDLIPGEERKLARPAYIVATVALLLAAVGVSYGNKSFGEITSWQGVFDTLPFIGDDSKPDDRMLAKEKGEKQSGIADAKVVGKTADLKDDELSITGNIEPRRVVIKSADRLSEEPLDEGITPESLLPMATGKSSLPPATIGPYSLRHDAANGKVEAQYEVARRYSLGLGVDVDFAEAVRWYMQAAAKGFAPAQYRLATFYERGRGVKRDLGKARLWYQRAAQLGNVKAMHNLAVITTAINRKKPDYQTSIYWFKQAANYNLADSQFNLAILYLNGVGVRKNPVEAYRWFSLAARHGDAEAAKRRDGLEKNLKKRELLQAANILQAWKPLARDPVANEVGLKGFHVTSTMSHADETLERSRILTAQILLRKLGYQVRNADGALNETTIAAIKKFEKDKGLPVTGKVNSGLIKMLNKSAL